MLLEEDADKGTGPAANSIVVVNMKTNEISPFASGDQRETCTEAEKKGEENRDEETRRHAGMKTE